VTKRKNKKKLKRSYWLIGLVIALVLLGAYYLSNTPGSSAFESFPGSLDYSLEAQSGEVSAGGYIVKANPGDTVKMWIKVKNLSNNPKSQVWYGKSALISEGEKYPNAHAIGVGVFEPLDWQPKWIEPSSFVIHGNRLTYYDGQPVSRGQSVELSWEIKIKANCPASVQELRLNLVREFDTWGNKVGGDRSIAWRFIVAGGGTDLDRINSSSEMGSYKELRVNGFAIKQVKINLNHPDLKIITDSAVRDDKMAGRWPALSMQGFIDRNGDVFAGIHGSYFCPAEKNYIASCGGNNTFYPMVYNTRIGKMINAYRAGYNKGGILVFDTKNKPYFFSSTKEFDSVASFEKKYNVKIQAAISNVPMLVYKGQVNFGNGEVDLKEVGYQRPAVRAAIGIKGYEAYLVVASSPSVRELAQIMKSLEMDSALNLDGGGSTALYYNKVYKAGPGRAIANAILFARK
jgi:hypothetical protein